MILLRGFVRVSMQFAVCFFFAFGKGFGPFFHLALPLRERVLVFCDQNSPKNVA